MKIGIVGCSGRMGRMLLQEVTLNKNTILMGGTEISCSPFIGDDLGTLIGQGDTGLLVGDNAEVLFEGSDCVIDFTKPDASLIHANMAAKFKTSLVLGTTGLSESQLATIQDYAVKTPIVYASNFSIGVNLLLEITEKAALVLGSDFDIEICEMHHRYKVDAPSGTALSIGEAAAKGAGLDLTKVSTRVRDGIVGPRKHGSIGFATLRGGSVVGEHSAIFVSDGERVELSHKATDRQIFASGAVRAALWSDGKKPGYYSMRDVLQLSD